MKNFLFILAILIIPIGITLRLFDIVGGNILLTFGFLGLFIFCLKRTINAFQTRISTKIIVLNILLALMSFCLFTKYLYHIFGDYPTLVILPLFIITSLIYLFTEQEKQTKLTVVTLLYLLLTIPLFGFEFNNSPMHYIPQSWYNRYGEPDTYITDLPFEFEYSRTEKLSTEALDLKKYELFDEAIEQYEEAKKIEPKNLHVLFNLSELYARSNELEIALTLLDTAISINDKRPEFYNNRGLIYYKLDENEKAIIDFKKGIELDSTITSFYANLATVYNNEKSYDIACEHIEKAISLGLNIKNYKHLKKIRAKRCE